MSIPPSPLPTFDPPLAPSLLPRWRSCSLPGTSSCGHGALWLACARARTRPTEGASSPHSTAQHRQVTDEGTSQVPDSGPLPGLAVVCYSQPIVSVFQCAQAPPGRCRLRALSGPLLGLTFHLTGGRDGYGAYPVLRGSPAFRAAAASSRRSHSPRRTASARRPPVPNAAAVGSFTAFCMHEPYQELVDQRNPPISANHCEQEGFVTQLELGYMQRMTRPNDTLRGLCCHPRWWHGPSCV
jgi:hypothetical protein